MTGGKKYGPTHMPVVPACTPTHTSTPSGRNRLMLRVLKPDLALAWAVRFLNGHLPRCPMPAAAGHEAGQRHADSACVHERQVSGPERQVEGLPGCRARI